MGDINGNNTAKKKVQKKKKINTEWYRKNKKERNVVHTCSHCDYSTTGPKIILTNHIYSKHTEEKDRPFQCSYNGCSRGFAQKGSLKKHMEKVHKEKPDELENKTIIEYHITLTKKTPKNIKTINRYSIYKQNPIINEKTFAKYILLKPEFITYDARTGYINVKAYTQRDLFKRDLAL